MSEDPKSNPSAPSDAIIPLGSDPLVVTAKELEIAEAISREAEMVSPEAASDAPAPIKSVPPPYHEPVISSRPPESAAIEAAPHSVSLSDALSQPVRVRSKEVPFWSLVGVFAVGLCLAVAIAATMRKAAPPPAPALAPIPDPPVIVETPPEPPPNARAALGDEGAMKGIEAKSADELLAEEVLALHLGKIAKRRQDLEAFASSLAQGADAPLAPDAVKRLRDAADDPDLARSALELAARLPSAQGADVLWDVAVGSSTPAPIADLAHSLARSADVRKRASAALAVAMDLDPPSSCDAAKSVLGKAKDSADRRAVAALAKLEQKKGCGEKKDEDCYPCLRDAEAKKLLGEIAASAKGREPPKVR